MYLIFSKDLKNRKIIIPIRDLLEELSANSLQIEPVPFEFHKKKPVDTIML